MFEEAVLGFLDVDWRGLGRTDARERAPQAVGQQCGGRYVDECRQQFGNALEMVCATCPD